MTEVLRCETCGGPLTQGGLLASSCPRCLFSLASEPEAPHDGSIGRLEHSEVESLLHAHDQAGSFLDTPPLEMESAVPAQERTDSMIGGRVGSFEILSLVGSGGMGEVYRARDTRLDRTVAIKFLPSRLSNNRELRQRLEREALAISRLNHPNICTLFDIGQHENADYLVMEHLEGETLEERLTRGALPLDQALRYGTQIADALQAAHRQGITHRDIKPANIMLVGDSCKLLDFGLAKLKAPLALAASGSATAGKNQTAKGTILGTVQYMAPEQLEGREVDGRTDIFAFGALLYEMVTGHKAFQGKSNASLIAAIMSSEPSPVSAFQPMSPRALDHVVRRCLAKSPEERWQTGLDVKKELEWILEGESGSNGVETAQKLVARTSRRTWLVGTASAAAGLAAGFLILRTKGMVPAPDDEKFPIVLDEGTALGSMHEYGGPAVSPDGSTIVLAVSENGLTHLYLRRRGIPELQRVEGTMHAHHPFWNPNNREVGFFADGKLKIVSTSGGTPEVLCPVSTASDNQGKGGTWNSFGDIIFAGAAGSPLYRYQFSTRLPVPLTRLEGKEGHHCWPWFLPDQKHFLYFARLPDEDRGAVCVGSLDSDLKQQVGGLEVHDSSVIYAAGHLLYVSKDRLVARPFDPTELAITGGAVGIDGPVAVVNTARACFSAADTGRLVFYDEDKSRLAQFDRNGGGRRYLSAVDRYGNLRLSQDGDILFYYVSGSREYYSSEFRDSLNPDNERLRVLNLKSGAPTVYNGGDSARALAFAADSQHVFFSGGGETGARNKSRAIYRTTLTFGNQPKLVLEDKDHRINYTALDVSHNDKYLLILRKERRNRKSPANLCYAELRGDGSASDPIPFENDTGFKTQHGRFSPKGLSTLWVAYTSDEGDGEQVYVRAFPPTKWRIPISLDGGSYPVWTKGGKEIVFQSRDNRLIAASLQEVNSELIVTERNALGITMPESSHGGGADGELRWWEVSPDGNTIYVLESLPTPVWVVNDWTAKLKT